MLDNKKNFLGYKWFFSLCMNVAFKLPFMFNTCNFFVFAVILFISSHAFSHFVHLVLIKDNCFEVIGIAGAFRVWHCFGQITYKPQEEEWAENSILEPSLKYPFSLFYAVEGKLNKRFMYLMLSSIHFTMIDRHF